MPSVSNYIYTVHTQTRRHAHTQIKKFFKIDWESNDVFSSNFLDVSDFILKAYINSTLYGWFTYAYFNGNLIYKWSGIIDIAKILFVPQLRLFKSQIIPWYNAIYPKTMVIHFYISFSNSFFKVAIFLSIIDLILLFQYIQILVSYHENYWR